MNRKGILFIPMSNNADSMSNIINIAFCDEICRDNKLPMVDKITFIISKDTDTAIKYKNEIISIDEFCKRIRSEIGDKCIETRQRFISNYANDIPTTIMDGIKETGRDNLIIDLTCGKKDITGSLYTTASLGSIKNMIYIEVLREDGGFPVLKYNDYENIRDKFILTKYESMNEIEEIASQNEMDFIFYKKNIQEIQEAVNSIKIESYCSQLSHVVEEYFSGKKENYINAIRTLGLINEDVIEELAKALYEMYGDLCEIGFNRKRPLNTIRELEGIFQEKGTKKEIIKEMEPVFSHIPAIFEMVEIVRIYRNRASHNNKAAFKKEEVKLLMDIILLAFSNLIECGIAGTIWEEEKNE